MNIRVLLLNLLGSSGEQADDVRLSGTDIDIADDGLVGTGNLIFRPLHEREDLFRALAQNHAFFR